MLHNRIVASKGIFHSLIGKIHRVTIPFRIYIKQLINFQIFMPLSFGLHSVLGICKNMRTNCLRRKRMRKTCNKRKTKHKTYLSDEIWLENYQLRSLLWQEAWKNLKHLQSIAKYCVRKSFDWNVDFASGK